MYQCALVFDSAVADRAPDLMRGPGADNPDYSGAGSGNFAIGCDSLAIDRMPPRIGLRLTAPPGGALPGEPVRFAASFSDAGSGPSGAWHFNFGDGRSADSPQPTVAHAYAEPGTYVVAASSRDAAGNLSYVLRTLEISSGDRLAVRVPSGLQAGRRVIRFRVTAAHAGNALLELRRHGETIAAADADLEQPGAVGINVRLDSPARAGTYKLRVRFTRTGERAPTDERVVTVKFRRRS